MRSRDEVSLEEGTLPLVLAGRFKPWAIDAGHSKLPIRGFLGEVESDEPPRIIDVLLQDVSRFSLSDRYPELHLAVADSAEMQTEEARVGGDWGNSSLITVGGRSRCDYVVAGFVFWAEVAINGGAPSPLM